MKQDNKILLILTDIFSTVFDDTSINLNKNTTSADIEEWDSLNQIKIILACEKKFVIRLNPREVNAFENIGEMVDHLISIGAKT